jgi:hypothetical protein
LEEIAMENAEIFSAGGKNFAAIPCLNDLPAAYGGGPRCRVARAKGWIDVDYACPTPINVSLTIEF